MAFFLIATIFLRSGNSYFGDIHGQKTMKSSPHKSPPFATVVALSKASPAPASPKGKIPTIVIKGIVKTYLYSAFLRVSSILLIWHFWVLMIF